MTIDLPVISSSKSKKKKKGAIGIPKWTVFSLSLITILLIIAITNAVLPLLFLGLVLAFIWTQATKPVAQFERELNPGGKQLNLFYQNQISNKESRNRIENKTKKRAA